MGKENKGDNNCIIVFDQNQHGTYFTGQVVTGKVIITLPKAKKLKGIKLQICGFASCQFKDKRGRKHPNHNTRGRHKHMYYGREDYIASTTYLVGSENSQNFSMDPGTYTYTFSCPIPLNCPSSFEGTFGHIRYIAKVSFIRAGASDRTYNVGFTVLKVMDLNQESRMLLVPASNEAMENFCFLHTKAVTLKVDIMQTGFVPGQFILVSTNVNNGSNIDCKRVMIVLNLRATYTSDSPYLRTKSERICLVKKICGPVARQSQKDFAEAIRVPATPPTCEHLSKVVRVAYEICVIAVMNHFMSNPKASIPITIGNVPLTTADYYVPSSDNIPTTSSCAMRIADANNFAMNATSLNDTEETEDDETGDDDDNDNGNTMEMPPPTYEEAMFMTTNIADDDVNTVSESAQFTPRYPVYNVDDILPVSPGDGPPPNKPMKNRKKRKAPGKFEKERPPVESPVQI